MKRDLPALAAIFAETYGAGLDPARVATALAATLEADRLRTLEPAVENEIHKRRLELSARRVFGDIEARTGITREQLVAPSPGRVPCPYLDEAVWRLRHEEEWSRSIVAKVVNRDEARVTAAVQRHEARLFARVGVPVVGRKAARR